MQRYFILRHAEAADYLSVITVLIDQLQRKLDLPRGAVCLGDSAEACTPHDVRWQAEVHQVKDIEEFGAELQRGGLRGSAPSAFGVFDQGHIEILVRRPPEGVASERPEPALIGASPA